jgi:hypothetical protein
MLVVVGGVGPEEELRSEGKDDAEGAIGVS